MVVVVVEGEGGRTGSTSGNHEITRILGSDGVITAKKIHAGKKVLIQIDEIAFTDPKRRHTQEETYMDQIGLYEDLGRTQLKRWTVKE